jgi:iron complex outermembrane receptor protein
MRRKVLLSAFVSLGAVMMATSAMAGGAPAGDAPAAAAAPDSSSTMLPEVVVTARKRAENLQTVPIAITAFSGAQLQQQGIRSATDLQMQVPSLSTESSNIESEQPMWGIRGQRSDSYFALQAPAVTTYFADVAQAHPAGFQKSLYDIASVDVLKGPQGTLFGKNSTGGAVVVEPNHPTETFEGDINATWANFGTTIINGDVNLPINDKLIVRIAAQDQQDNGLERNLAPGGPAWNRTDADAIRISVLAKPFSNVQSLTIFDDYRDHGTPGGVRLFYVNPFSNATNPAGSFLARFAPATATAAEALFAQEQAQTGTDRWSTASAYGTHTANDKFQGGPLDDVQNEGITNDTTVELGDDLKIRNIVAARRASTLEDIDYGGGDYFIVTGRSLQGIHQFSEEFQLLGDSFDKKLQWVAGLYYIKESATEDNVAPNFLSINEIQGGGVNTSYAAFAQGTYQVTDRLRFTAGLRYNRDVASAFAESRSLQPTTALQFGKTTPKACSEGTFTTAGGFVAFPLSQCLLQNSASFTKPTWTLSLEYQVPDTWIPAENALLYLTSRRGYRAGGFNIHATYAQTFGPYQPEIDTDFEAGFKGDWNVAGGGHLRTNLAVYYDHFDDLQRTVNVEVPNNPIPLSTIRNAATSRVFGTELEWTYFPLPSFEFYGFADYTNAKYIKYASLTATGAPLDLSNNPFVDTPQSKFSLNARYLHSFADNLGDFSATANYTWQADIKLAEQPIANGTIPTQAAYGLWNFRADVKNVGGKPLDVGIWVKNAFDKYYNVGFADISESLGIAVVLPGEPRMFGIDVHYHF